MPLSQARVDPFRHVVFKDAPYRMGRAIDLSPVDSSDAPRAPERSILPEDAAFLRGIFNLAKLDLAAYRLEALVRRIPACLRAIRAGSRSEARTLLRCRPNLLWPAMNALLIGVTGFFRDPAVFDLLRRELNSRPKRQSPKIWSIGCSDGAELYSMAIVLDELNLLDGARLLGTDCRPDAIDNAQRGIYDDSLLKELPARLRERYFEPCSGQWAIHRSLSAAVQWRAGDFMQSIEPGPWDLILCRNVAIYLQMGAADKLWKQLAATLQPGGLLVIGKSERPDSARHLIPVGPCVYRHL